MYLRCYYCGHTMPLARGQDGYEGTLRCRVCRNQMTVRLESGYLRSMTPSIPEVTPEPASDPRRPNNRQVPTEAAA